MRFRIDIPASFLRGLSKTQVRKLAPLGQEIGQEVVDEIRVMAYEELVNDRPEPRRNLSHGKPHFAESWSVGATDTSGGRVRTTVRSSSPEKLVGILEHGSPEHDIDGPGRYPLVTRRDQGGIYEFYGDPFVAYGGEREPVHHRGTKPYKFIARARATVKARQNTLTMRVRLHASR